MGPSFGMVLIIPRARHGHPILQTTGDLGIWHLRHVFDVRTDSGEDVVVCFAFVCVAIATLPRMGRVFSTQQRCSSFNV